MEYPKINSLWKREGWYFDQDKKNSPDYQKGRQSFIEGDYACPEVGMLGMWQVEEKIDGTNIRIMFRKENSDAVGALDFRGRSDEAQIPKPLLDYLQAYFTRERLGGQFSGPVDLILFGEGYGAKIQGCGTNYRKDQGFILFDVNINGIWLDRESVWLIGHELGIPIAPPLGIMTTNEVVEFVKSKPQSKCSITPQVMEGVICRSSPLMLFRNGKPIMWKLKTREFP